MIFQLVELYVLVYVLQSETNFIPPPPKKIQVEGQYFGEIALLTGGTRTAYIMAKTYCTVSILSKDVFDDIHTKFPGAFVKLIKRMRSIYKVNSSVSLETVCKHIWTGVPSFANPLLSGVFETEEDLTPVRENENIDLPISY
jgi:hypothetical protein